MKLAKELKKVVHFVEKHGADKVLDALEGVADLGLDALVDATPAEFKLLTKTAASLAESQLHKAVVRLEHKLEGDAPKVATDVAPVEAS